MLTAWGKDGSLPADDWLGTWGRNMPNGILVLGSSFVLFWNVTMLVFFSPAEEV